MHCKVFNPFVSVNLIHARQKSAKQLKSSRISLMFRQFLQCVYSTDGDERIMSKNLAREILDFSEVPPIFAVACIQLKETNGLCTVILLNIFCSVVPMTFDS